MEGDHELELMLAVLDKCVKGATVGGDTTKNNEARVRRVTGLETKRALNALYDGIVFATTKTNGLPMATPGDKLGHVILDAFLMGLEMGSEFTKRAFESPTTQEV